MFPIISDTFAWFQPGNQNASPAPSTSVAIVRGQDADIPSTVTNEEDTLEIPQETPKAIKRKRPAKKRSAEQEKADKIIQEAIAKAKSEGREVPKVIETEDGQQITIPPQKKKASPKRKKGESAADKEKKEKKIKEAKEVKPKAPPKARPPKRKK